MLLSPLKPFQTPSGRTMLPLPPGPRDLIFCPIRAELYSFAGDLPTVGSPDDILCEPTVVNPGAKYDSSCLAFVVVYKGD